MLRETCHFYGEKRCGILTAMVCESGKCSFHKTTEEFKEGLKKYPVCNYVNMHNKKHKKSGEHT